MLRNILFLFPLLLSVRLTAAANGSFYQVAKQVLDTEGEQHPGKYQLSVLLSDTFNFT